MGAVYISFVRSDTHADLVHSGLGAKILLH
jgi:hypothetical protein